jgi:dolichol-phosphate mannosyltransferase
MDRKIVIIPTYNEIENIENIIRKTFSITDVHILVVDDGSPDGTGKKVKELMEEFPERLFIIERTGKLGLGTAYIAGFKWALENNYDYVFEMDADFSHNPEDLDRLYHACAVEGADLAIGSRYCKGVNVLNWPMGRLLMSYYGSMYVRFILGMSVKDTTAGFKCYKASTLRQIDFKRIKHIGYGFQIE